jgi:hypothetical protein
VTVNLRVIFLDIIKLSPVVKDCIIKCERGEDKLLSILFVCFDVPPEVIGAIIIFFFEF